MKIVQLQAENFKKLRAVTIRPDGSVVTIAGDNGAGKTSTLDAIAAAIGGEKLCPAEPIRRGEKAARVVVELDEDMIVERRFTPGGSRLEVRSKAGLKYPSPQKMLDGLVGRLSFDPLAFLRLKPAEQADTLRTLAGVDFSLLDARRRGAYEQRQVANRSVAQLKARLAAIPEDPTAPDAPESAAELLTEHERRQKVKGANEVERAALQRARDLYAVKKRAVEDATAEVVRARQALEAAEERQRGAEAALEEAKTKGEEIRARVEQLVDPDLDEIPGKLRDVEKTNDRYRVKQQRAGLVGELAAAEAEATKADAEIAAIDEQKEAALRDAKFPVEGLGFTETGVTLNGFPLEQASGAEQLRVSLAMGIALNPKLRVLLIRDGSLLDSKSLALVAQMAEQAGCQVWLETVGKNGTGIVIEDGVVEGAEAPTAQKGAA